MSVTMEDKVEKKKGRRVTKNSSGLTTRSEETSLEKALRKSQKEQRKQERKKAKEDKELERVLELSKRDMGRIESASHLLKLKSSSPPSPPVLIPLTMLRRQRNLREKKGSGKEGCALSLGFQSVIQTMKRRTLILSTLRICFC